MKQHLNRLTISMGALALGIVGAAMWAAPASAAIRPQIATQAHASTTCNGYLPTGSVAAMAATTDGGGYWIADSAGLVVACGDAPNLGSVSITLAKPIVSMASTPDGGGFWLVASDGGIFTFGDAKYFGSTGALHLNRPIVGMTTTTDGNGYWLVASDGGMFAFGDAHFHGSTGSLRLNQPVVGMATDAVGGGYWLAGRTVGCSRSMRRTLDLWASTTEQAGGRDGCDFKWNRLLDGGRRRWNLCIWKCGISRLDRLTRTQQAHCRDDVERHDGWVLVRRFRRWHLLLRCALLWIGRCSATGCSGTEPSTRRALVLCFHVQRKSESILDDLRKCGVQCPQRHRNGDAALQDHDHGRQRRNRG